MSSNLLLVSVWFSLVYLCGFNIFIVQSKVCPRFNNITTKCMVIQDCPELFSLAQKKPISENNMNHLRNVHCGYSTNKQPKVCCNLPDLLPSRDVCGKQIEDKIFGGTQTTIREYPWMVLLEYQEPTGREFKCGGFLINNRYVLTAAHCVVGLPECRKLISVRLGEHNLKTARDCYSDTCGLEDCSDEPLDLTIDEQIPHEMYSRSDTTRRYDIALLRLGRTVNITTPYIRPLCLPLSQRLRNKDYIGQELIVAGWGQTEANRRSDVKLKVKVPVKPKNECTSVYKAHGVNFLGDSQICAGGVQKKDSCTGDSGGPLMVVDRTETEENYIAYGLVSFGPKPCGLKNFPAVYTRVADFIDWIRDHLKP